MPHFKGRLLDENEDKTRKQRVKLHNISMSVPGGEAWEREKRLLELIKKKPKGLSKRLKGKFNKFSALVELSLPSHVPVHVQLPQKDNRLQ